MKDGNKIKGRSWQFAGVLLVFLVGLSAEAGWTWTATVASTPDPAVVGIEAPPIS